MSDMVRMSAQDRQAAADQMRLANTARLKGLIDQLEPYLDGTLGPLSPRHAQVYLKAVRELGLLWGSYAPAQPAEEQEVGIEAEVMVLAARQEAVLAELDKLAQLPRRRVR